MGARFEVWELPGRVLQLQIVDENGGGWRIFGPPFDSRSRLIRSYDITPLDAVVLRRYIAAGADE